MLPDNMKRDRKPHEHQCEVETAFAVIGGKWKPQIIWLVGKVGSPRFNELRGYLARVSPRMLSKQLRELEEDGLVVRTLYPEVPLRVEYQLTDAGKALVPIIDDISTWAMEYCSAA